MTFPEQLPKDLKESIASLALLRGAQNVFAFWSHDTFLITTASSKARDGREIASLELDSGTGFILVGHAETAHSKWGMWMERDRWVRVGKWEYCRHPDQVAETVQEAIDRELGPTAC